MLCVLGIKEKGSGFGGYRVNLRMINGAEGWFLWGLLPFSEPPVSSVFPQTATPSEVYLYREGAAGMQGFLPS